MKTYLRHLSGALGRWAATLLLVGAAIVVARLVWSRYETQPWTRDGHVRADVVRVSSDVGGQVTRVLVNDNEQVRAGQLLFVLDRPRFEGALEQAKLALQTAEANIRSAESTIRSAEANLDFAQRESRRDLALGNLVATESREHNVSKVEAARSALVKAQADHRAALLARDAALVARDMAQLNLERTEVHASVNGVVTNLDLHPGDYLSQGTQALALVNTESLRVEGYFEETKLNCVNVGDRAVVRLMGDDHDLAGHVESIAAGIADDQRSNTHNLLPAVQPTFSWVRLAQRIPVRIRIEKESAKTRLIVGRTATVSVVPHRSGECR